ncbi:Bud site selection protein 14 [Nakaseomyces bracarensis]|uniref:Bud site selection protein 14 n=1 Tax=Nakaseomyces bracarensis TaxID=273131 RepID=A0ABR4NVT0_9SACH
MDFSKPRSFAAKVGGAKVDSLLHDPSLVDDYTDILRLKPPREESVESSSNMGSVVVTPAATSEDLSKQLGHGDEKVEEVRENADRVENVAIGETHVDTVRSSMISNTSSRYSMRSESYQNQLSELPEASDNGHEEERELNFNESSSSEDETYNYSDSDFEDNLQERMKNIEVTSAGSFVDNMDQEDNDEFEETVQDNIGETDEVASTTNGINGLELDSSDDDNEGMLDFGDEEDELDEEDDYRPLPPPKELDPDKLYALYPFNGPDSSHCQLEQDEACMLLNDQDAYWWLVKRCSDKKIGFAPAEILETFPERLARLNCWKNENMSTHSFIRSDGTIERIFDNPSGSDIEDHEEVVESVMEDSSKDSTPTKTSERNNKSVSFNDVVEYAKRFIDEEYSDSDNEEVNELRHYDEYSEGQLEENNLYGNDGIIDDDDVSEVASDVSFGTNNMAPLNIKKVRIQQTKEDTEVLNNSDIESDSEDKSNSNVSSLRKDGLRSTSPLPENNHTTNNENTNISFELDALDNDDLEFTEQEVDSGTEQNNGVPIVDDYDKQSKNSFEDINENNQQVEEDTVFKVFQAPNIPFAPNQNTMSNSNSNYSISTIGEYSPSSAEFASDSPKSEKMLESNVIPSSKAVRDIADLIRSDEESNEHNVDSNRSIEENKDDTSVSSINDEDGFEMDDENHELGSSTSINSAFSTSKNLPSRSGSSITSESVKHHAVVQELYSPMFLQMDSLLQQLDDIVQ